MGKTNRFDTLLRGGASLAVLAFAVTGNQAFA